MTTLLHISFCCVSHAVVSGTYASVAVRILGLIKSAYHGWLNMMTPSEGPILVLSRPPQP